MKGCFRRGGSGEGLRVKNVAGVICHPYILAYLICRECGNRVSASAWLAGSRLGTLARGVGGMNEAPKQRKAGSCLHLIRFCSWSRTRTEALRLRRWSDGSGRRHACTARCKCHVRDK